MPGISPPTFPKNVLSISTGSSKFSIYFLLVPCSAYSSTLKMEVIFPSETSDFTEPYGVLSQKIVFLVIAAFGTSSPE
jgi:hypothetical protein